MAGKPSVLYVAPEIPVPHAGAFLGGSTHVMEVSRALVGNGFEVHVICRRVARGQPSFEMLEDGFYVHRFFRGLVAPVEGVASKKGGKPTIMGNIKKIAETIYFKTIYRSALIIAAVTIIRKHRIAAVLERNSARGIGAFSARLSGRPLVEEVIDPDFSKTAVRMADRVFAYTPRVLEGAVDAGRISITSAGVDTRLFAPMDGTAIRKKYGLGGKKVVVYVGEMSAWHGIDVLVRAAARLDDAYRILILSKRGEDVKPLASELGVLDRLVFTGFVDHADVPRYISAADVAAAPYDPSGSKEMQKYGFYFSPIKIFEYMACARPVIASDVDIVRDVISSSDCGVLVRPGDPEALAQAIKNIAEKPAVGAAMGESGRRACVEKYDWSRVGGDIASALRALI